MYPKKDKETCCVACPKCNTKTCYNDVISIVKCNVCDYEKESVRKIKFKKARCEICARKRKVQDYINEKTKEIRQLCFSCAGVKKTND